MNGGDLGQVVHGTWRGSHPSASRDVLARARPRADPALPRTVLGWFRLTKTRLPSPRRASPRGCPRPWGHSWPRTCLGGGAAGEGSAETFTPTPNGRKEGKRRAGGGEGTRSAHGATVQRGGGRGPLRRGEWARHGGRDPCFRWARVAAGASSACALRRATSGSVPTPCRFAPLGATWLFLVE